VRGWRISGMGMVLGQDASPRIVNLGNALEQVSSS
jgi:hypothetical protein